MATILDLLTRIFVIIEPIDSHLSGFYGGIAVLSATPMYDDHRIMDGTGPWTLWTVNTGRTDGQEWTELEQLGSLSFESCVDAEQFAYDLVVPVPPRVWTIQDIDDRFCGRKDAVGDLAWNEVHDVRRRAASDHQVAVTPTVDEAFRWPLLRLTGQLPGDERW